MGDVDRKLVTVFFLFVCADKSFARPDHTKEGLIVQKKCDGGASEAKSEASPRTCVR